MCRRCTHTVIGNLQNGIHVCNVLHLWPEAVRVYTTAQTTAYPLPPSTQPKPAHLLGLSAQAASAYLKDN